jgi:autotransporter-associated beta strand protein
MGLSGANTARTLTLAGSSGDGLSQNTLAAVIGDNGTGATTVVKNGTGAWKLTGVNTFSGGLTVNSGTLYLGNGYAAGTGTLTFKDTTSFGISGALSVGNALSLQSGGVRMDITSGSDLVVLTGAVSGSALLSLYGNGTLTLSGSNSGWSGGIMLHDYSVVNANSANAFGVGGLLFDPASDSTVNVNTDLVVRGLAGSSDPSTINITGSYNFTVNQTSDSTYAGYLNGSGNLIKSGTGALTLTNSNNYSGTTTINGGTIIAQGGSYNGQLGNGAVTINSGAKLQVSNSTLYNNVTIQSGGRLQGSGNVNSATITSGGILSAGTPGGIEIGSLGFNDLTLKGGGILEWNLQNPNGSAGTGYDSITISTPSTLHLDGTLSAGTPFTIKVISLTSGGTPGLSTGFAGGAYTWTIFDASSSNIAGTFDSSFFVIDTSGFSSDGGVGNFSFNQSGKLLQLTFTPVPEPTTWAMLISGVGLVGLLRRQRGVRRA